ncbi:MAG TPA: polysaccharide deacetylase family protein [Terracidiphilus sp.]|nr:polysaccharide deacetylase family protein [Terracidiphilus sp.]
MPDAGLLTRVRNRILRETGYRYHRRLVRLEFEQPVVSFTFDDFPRTALYEGGAILKRHGAAGTYYACAGLMGKMDAAGEMFTRRDLEYLIAQGHELGCHTYGHHDAMLTMPATFERSIIANRAALSALCPQTPIRAFSYPKAEPHAGVKRVAARHAACCRAGGQTLNSGIADLNCLKSFFLEQSRHDPAAIRQAIEMNRDAKGWLIFSTHDVSENPSPYGCTPGFFEMVVNYAAQSARIITVGKVCEMLSAAARAGKS